MADPSHSTHSHALSSHTLGKWGIGGGFRFRELRISAPPSLEGEETIVLLISVYYSVPSRTSLLEVELAVFVAESVYPFYLHLIYFDEVRFRVDYYDACYFGVFI